MQRTQRPKTPFAATELKKNKSLANGNGNGMTHWPRLLIAAVGPQWPAARPPEGKRLPRPQRCERRSRRQREQADARASRQQQWQAGLSSHEWTSWRGVRRCRSCGVPWSSTVAAASSCMRSRKIVADVCANPRGHRLMAVEKTHAREDTSSLVICMACGAYSETGSSPGLAAECRKDPTRRGAEALRRVRAGVHPRTDANSKVGAAAWPVDRMPWQLR